jgi:hypothetical protein
MKEFQLFGGIGIIHGNQQPNHTTFTRMGWDGLKDAISGATVPPPAIMVSFRALPHVGI